MPTARINDPERLFPADPTVRSIAAELYESVRDLPIVSPHGHTDPAWFAQDDLSIMRPSGKATGMARS